MRLGCRSGASMTQSRDRHRGLPPSRFRHERQGGGTALGKRGQAEMLEWFPRLMLLLIALIVIAMLVRYFVDREVVDDEVSRNAYLYRLYYDDIIMHVENGRTYPGIVDLAKFTDETFSQYPRPDIASRLTVTGRCVPGGEKTITHNEGIYTENLPFARFGTLGPGGATMQEDLFPVTVHTDGTRCAGMLNITIVRPNS